MKIEIQPQALFNKRDTCKIFHTTTAEIKCAIAWLVSITGASAVSLSATAGSCCQLPGKGDASFGRFPFTCVHGARSQNLFVRIFQAAK